MIYHKGLRASPHLYWKSMKNLCLIRLRFLWLDLSILQTTPTHRGSDQILDYINLENFMIKVSKISQRWRFLLQGFSNCLQELWHQFLIGSKYACVKIKVFPFGKIQRVPCSICHHTPSFCKIQWKIYQTNRY